MLALTDGRSLPRSTFNTATLGLAQGQIDADDYWRTLETWTRICHSQPHTATASRTHPHIAKAGRKQLMTGVLAGQRRFSLV
jgi:hypothetical protein